jgi:hypothetical protein
MSEVLTRIEWDGATGETKVIPLTAAEIAEREAQAAQFAIEQAAREAAEAEAVAKKAAVLKALADAAGLTVDEVTAVLN